MDRTSHSAGNSKKDLIGQENYIWDGEFQDVEWGQKQFLDYDQQQQHYLLILWEVQPKHSLFWLDAFNYFRF